MGNLKRDEQIRESEITKQLEKLATELATLMERKHTVSWTVPAGPYYSCEVYRKKGLDI